MEISSGGANWRPWSVFTSGAYRAHLGRETDRSGGTGGYVVPGPDGVTTPAERLADAVNPFEGWSDDLVGVGVKLAAGGAALALVVLGLSRLVDR